MSTGFHVRVRQLLEAATQCRTTERVAFINSLAGRSPGLAREVGSLLPHYLAAEALALQPRRPVLARLRTGHAAALASATDDLDEWTPPFALAPYRVVEVLGRGGMSVV